MYSTKRPLPSHSPPAQHAAQPPAQPLSPNKAKTHFPRLREATGVPYNEMLFFDDCNWGNHCGQVAAACKENGASVVTVRTPHGLGVADFRKGLAAFADAQAAVR